MNKKPNLNFYRVRYELPSPYPPQNPFQHWATWRLDLIKALMGLAGLGLFTVCISIAGLVGLIVGLALWWCAMSLADYYVV